MTEWLRLESGRLEGPIAQAAAVLKRGGVVLFPAERLYGLAADAMNAEAVQRVFQLKAREARKPLPVIVGELEPVFELAAVPDLARPLMERFWPGPLTLVLSARVEFPEGVLGEGGGLGVRVPGNELARGLSLGLSGPVTATSANLSGRESGAGAESALADLEGEVDLVLDAGPLPGPPGSTVIRIEGSGIKILRLGIVSREELKQSLRGERFTWT